MHNLPTYHKSMCIIIPLTLRYSEQLYQWVHAAEVYQKEPEIINGGKSTDHLNDEFRLFPSMNFTCSGRITGLQLGADIRWSNNFIYHISNDCYGVITAP